MKAAPEGTYDAVIVDSSDPIGIRPTWTQVFHMINLIWYADMGIILQVRLKNFLRSLSLSQLQKHFVPVVLCAHKLRAYGSICTLLKILLQIAVRYLKVRSTMLGQQFLHIQGNFMLNHHYCLLRKKYTKVFLCDPNFKMQWCYWFHVMFKWGTWGWFQEPRQPNRRKRRPRKIYRTVEFLQQRGNYLYKNKWYIILWTVLVIYVSVSSSYSFSHMSVAISN